MRLLACTVTHRPPELSRPSIEHVLRTCPECDLLIVNNGGNPNAYASHGPAEKRVTVIHLPTNVGHPAGAYFGIHLALSLGYEFFLLLDDDIQFLTTDWYQKCLDLMAFDPRIGVIGAKLLMPDQQKVHTARCE